MDATEGDAAIAVGLIDGPVDLDHPALTGSALSTVAPHQRAACLDAASAACAHGTAIAGILCARRGGSALAIAPGCTVLLHPLFGENGAAAAATPGELARAIVATVDAGARVINLSLGVIASQTGGFRDLDRACDHAAARGALLVAAAGNQGRIGFVPLLNHPWVLPVAACDAAGLLAPESNISPTIARRGLRAPGLALSSLAPGGGDAPVSGTSAAAAVATGAIALLWSLHPAAPAHLLRAAVLDAPGRRPRSLVPPLLDAEVARTRLGSIVTRKETAMPDGIMPVENGQTAPAAQAPRAVRPASEPVARRRPAETARVIAASAPCPTCATGEAAASGPPTFIYALGHLQVRFPSPAIEKEFAQVIATDSTARLTDQAVLHRALAANRYLANEVCWVFVIDSAEAYVLVPRDQAVLDSFVEATRPSDTATDTDIIIGTRGPMAPAEMCNGLIAPIAVVDRIYSFARPELMAAIQLPPGAMMTEAEFRPAANELFDRIQQLADNVGATDEHRAVNYLAVRYDQIYAQTAAMFARNFSLSGVEVLPSRLAGTRRLVNVVFTYSDRAGGADEKYRVRVDVTEKYPFLDKKISPYFDRD
jgi:hypothetical protein